MAHFLFCLAIKLFTFEILYLFFASVLKKAPIDTNVRTPLKSRTVYDGRSLHSQHRKSGALCSSGTCARFRLLRAWCSTPTLLGSGGDHTLEWWDAVVGIKSRVSVLGHVRGRRGRGERRRAGEVESREERADEGKNRGPQQNRLIALRHRPRRSTAHPSPPPRRRHRSAP